MLDLLKTGTYLLMKLGNCRGTRQPEESGRGGQRCRSRDHVMGEAEGYHREV